MPRKIGSVASNLMASGVRSPPGKCCSIAMTRQFAMIVTRIVYSNGGHSMINLVNRRNGWSWANKNNEVGPAGGEIGGCGAISILAFWRGVDAVWIVTLGFEANVGASCAANLHKWITIEMKTFFFSEKTCQSNTATSFGKQTFNYSLLPTLSRCRLIWVIASFH